MKLYIFVLLAFTLNVSILAQGEIVGKVVYLNSNGLPAYGVKVSAYGSNSDYSRDSGKFKLVFPILQAGSIIKPEIGDGVRNTNIKDELGHDLELVNKKETEHFCIPKDPLASPLIFIVCLKGARDLVIRKYYEIIKSSTEKAYAKLKKKYEELNVEHKKDFKHISDLSNQISLQEEQMDSLNFERQAENLASINKDDAPDRILKYLAAIDSGESIQDAISILDVKSASKDLNESLKVFDKIIMELGLRVNSLITIFEYKAAMESCDTIIYYLQKRGGDPLLLASYYNMIADILMKSGEINKALVFQQKCIAIQVEKLAPSHTDLASSYNNLALIYQDLGQFNLAIDYERKALYVREKNSEKMDPLLASVYNNLAKIYYSNRELNLALEYANKSMLIREAVLDSMDINLAKTYNNLAMIYEGQKHAETALLFELKAIKIQTKKLKANRSDLALSFSNVSHIYKSLNDFDKAFEYQEKSISIRKEIFGNENPYLSESYNNKASLLFQSNQIDKALEFQVICVKLQEKIDSKNPIIAIYLNNLGYYYWKLNDFKNALLCFQKCSQVIQELRGKKSLEIANNFHNIALTFFSLKDYQNALDYFLRSISLSVEIIENGESDIIKYEFEDTDWHYIGRCYYNLKNYSLAISSYKKAAELFPRYKRLNYYNNIGLAFAKNKQFKEAKESFEENEKLDPSDNKIYRNWGVYYALKGEKVRALENFNKAIKMGYKDLEWFINDDSLDMLCGDADFKEMLKVLKVLK